MQISAYFCCEILRVVASADLFGKTAETRTGKAYVFGILSL